MTPRLSPTLNELFDFYEKECLPTKALQTQRHQRALFTRLRPTLGPLPVEALTPIALKTWRDRLCARLKSGTVREYMDVLSAVLTVAVEDLHWLPTHPMKRVKRPPASPRRVRFLSLEEQERLLAACRLSRNAVLYPLVVLALVTGGRRSELFGLHWEDVDLERGYLRLQETKNGVRRAVPIASLALPVLVAWGGGRPRPAAWVFPRRRDTTAFPGEYSWHEALKRAKISNFRFHDLRHTAASYLAMSGARLEDIADVLGHKTLAVTQRYRHVTLSHTQAIVDRMGKAFLVMEAPALPGTQAQTADVGARMGQQLLCPPHRAGDEHA